MPQGQLVAPARRTRLGDDGNQIAAHSALLAASKQSEDGRIPHLNGSFPVFIFGMDDWGEKCLDLLAFLGV
jgi:hypothetical protein